MTINEWATIHPATPFRVLLYTCAPDIIEHNGNLICGGEGTCAVVFDSTISGDLPFDLIHEDIIAINEGDDGITELEYINTDLY